MGVVAQRLIEVDISKGERLAFAEGHPLGERFICARPEPLLPLVASPEEPVGREMFVVFSFSYCSHFSCWRAAKGVDCRMPAETPTARAFEASAREIDCPGTAQTRT